jgi:hypothetical protein
MSKKLFVGGLSWGTTDVELREAFEQFGGVSEAKVILDRDSGRSRGFGFVTFSDPTAAENAVQAMDGQDLDGRCIRVNEAHDKPRASGGGGGRNEGGGGGSVGRNGGGSVGRSGGGGVGRNGGGGGGRNGGGGGRNGGGGRDRDRDRGDRDRDRGRGRDRDRDRDRW